MYLGAFSPCNIGQLYIDRRSATNSISNESQKLQLNLDELNTENIQKLKQEDDSENFDADSTF